VSLCTLSVESLARSADFYENVIGLERSDTELLQGAAFERHWHLPAGARAHGVVMFYPDSAIGRILLVEFEAPAENVRGARLERHFLGLWNLNFYTTDIGESTRRLVRAGCTAWTEPTSYDVSATTGKPTEVIVDGPDGVIFNLVQPEGSRETQVGRVRAFLDARGLTRTGFTEVVTTAHHVSSMDQALRFFRDALGLEVLIDEVFANPASNRFLDLPEDARSWIVFLKGDSLFGKVVLMQPLNFEAPSFVDRMVPPHVGYLAMGFDVDDLHDAVSRCVDVGAELYSGPDELALPGLGLRQSVLLRTPGSGALTQLIAAR
jgi:catechol 2,3-dioxygenase-like lactoylglutathione lyase family enzyme